MAEYKIGMVDSAEPKRWDGPNGSIFYINVGLEGHPKLVSIGKKTPDALKVGDTVYGTIQPTDYLTDKWKHDPKPQGGGSSGSGGGDGKFQRDVTALSLDVYRVVANIRGLPDNAGDSAKFWEIVMDHTNELLNMINKVRSGDEANTPSPTAQEEAPSLKDTWEETKKDKSVGWAQDLPPSDEDYPG